MQPLSATVELQKTRQLFILCMFIYVIPHGSTQAHHHIRAQYLSWLEFRPQTHLRLSTYTKPTLCFTMFQRKYRVQQVCVTQGMKPVLRSTQPFIRCEFDKYYMHTHKFSECDLVRAEKYVTSMCCAVSAPSCKLVSHHVCHSSFPPSHSSCLIKNKLLHLQKYQRKMCNTNTKHCR